MNIQKEFPKGVLYSDLLMGTVNAITANTIVVSLFEAEFSSGSYYLGGRYGKGEVGEFIIVESQTNLVMGRVVEVKRDDGSTVADSIARIQLLGSICMESLKVIAGVESYPRLGDRVFAAPHKLIAMIPQLMDYKSADKLVLKIGSIDVAQESVVEIKPEKLFGRHLAILGSTGGGKSYTTTKIIEECLRFDSKMILLDATGEYSDLENKNTAVKHVHLSNPIKVANDSKACILPPTSFQETDFIALFEPSGKVQGPKFKEAIKSLRIAGLCKEKFFDGYIKKNGQLKSNYNEAINNPDIQAKIDDPSTPFDITKLVQQITEECVYPTSNRDDHTRWGGPDDGSYSFCLSLITRINCILHDSAFDCIFGNYSPTSLTSEIDSFLTVEKTYKLLRIDLSGISFAHKAREIIANNIGRYLLKKAREAAFIQKPLVVFVDEAHNFLGKNLGSDDAISKLDSFELIAKEGRKFGLNICLATQRPRDIPEGVLSQIGTLVVHRLTNERDRNIVEHACGEIDQSISSFLPNLKPGEAAIIGNDFPIPLTVQIYKPNCPPTSSGTNYQQNWQASA